MIKKVLVLLACVLLFGCQTGETDNQVSITSNPFIGGSQGLVLNFESLRTDVFDGGSDPFDVIVRLENKGETFVGSDKVTVKLSGFNPVDFGKSEEFLVKNAPDDVIETRKDPQGAVLTAPQVFVEFSGLNFAKKISGAAAEFIVRADVCYLYTTHAVSKLCVRENLLTPAANGICEMNADKPVFNSGAPVQIAYVKEAIRAKDKLGFSFEIKNSGTGSVFERDSDCDRVDRKKENRVYVSVSTGLSGLSCTGLESTASGAEGFVTLYSGSKIVSCAQTISTRSDFEQLMNIEVIYDYEERTQSTFKVKSSGAE